MDRQAAQPRPQRPHTRDPIQIIRLEAYDDATSVRDRLQFVELRRVLLMFPAQGRILRRRIDLLLVVREAQRRGLKIALLTQDPEVLEQAAEIGLSAFLTVRQARAHPPGRFVLVGGWSA
ncbi:MAG: hypothetical protein HC915_17655, partial [Anaerolineae bacterium]|nr:hypothetical protein [Anaerolineae bacterium]